MTLPWRFPEPTDEARKRAEEFQRLSPEDRWRELAALMAFGWWMVRSSPRRAVIEQRMDEQEQEWKRIQKELFARHGQ